MIKYIIYDHVIGSFYIQESPKMYIFVMIAKLVPESCFKII